MPKIWWPDIELFDLLIAPTSFIASACSQLDIQIEVAPHEVHINLDRILTTREMGLPDDRPIHFYSFAFASFSSRKNPLLFAKLQEEFCRNFDFAKDLFLLRSSDSPRTAEDYRLNQTLLGLQNSNFLYQFGGKTRLEHISTIAQSSSFVSVHRSEGLGLQLIEALLLNTPILSHAYSGPSDFLYESDPGIYPFSLEQIRKSEYPFAEGQFWANATSRDIFDAFVKTKQNPEIQSEVRNRVRMKYGVRETALKMHQVLDSL